ncbi:YciI family protein [Microbispora sp. NPDC088329]|uniref:YciI family protein n=1 Tax=unclassified Microbispora TaxID=2614687 RepID=UPI0034139EE5
MRFLMTTKGTDPNPDAAMMAEMGAFIEEMTRAGVLLATGGLEPGGVRMVSSGGRVTVTDGPFTEAKEAIVSFALIEARSREEAVELARRFWEIVGDGEGSVQQVFGPEDAPGAGPR